MLANSPKWLNGPAKLTQAFGLDGSLNGHDLTKPESEVFVVEGIIQPEALLQSSPRIGLGKTPEPWLSIAWRWEIKREEVYNRIQKDEK